ncbi:toxin ParE1/3/4 [Kordia periserrulae]|uniref:Toxin n=1 Tax=Kordia periserrulae TaxID=701523 RepID=A0A2T6BYH7_9FLAO|nr:type II toxin-antitoxin system RelE/ParE family toxin [Kordia periserrulae]PTX61144.1 toxin ParE1/3/4 [Kordia periserrulae]
MTNIIFRQKAVDDLSEIWNYTLLNWSENQADQYYKLIQAACVEISKNPSIGKSYENIHNKLLGFKTGKHIIFYRQSSKNSIEIVRILHERMDLENRIQE